MKHNKKQWQDRRAICVEIPLLKARVGALGLYRTMHALEEAVKAVGWEVATMEAEELGKQVPSAMGGAEHFRGSRNK